ncbi:LuxR family transcriptional regulator, partial [Photobacterium chitinilyticum]
MTLTNYSKEKEQIFRDRNIHKILIRYCKENRIPVLWGKLEKPRQNHYYFNYISDRNIRTMPPSFTIPIHNSIGRFSTISFSLKEANDYNQDLFFYAASLAQTIIPYLQDKIDETALKNSIKHQQLTSRETEALMWATEGKSAWEIAKIFDCSERTVSFHLQNACNKLDASNKYQAISKGILSGIIFPN